VACGLSNPAVESTSSSDDLLSAYMLPEEQAFVAAIEKTIVQVNNPQQAKAFDGMGRTEAAMV
jgi:hypothetical protein